MRAQTSEPVAYLPRIRDDHPAFTRRYYLVETEAEIGGVPERTDPLPVVNRAERMTASLKKVDIIVGTEFVAIFEKTQRLGACLGAL